MAMLIEKATPESLRQLEAELLVGYQHLQAQKLDLDLTRGKPSAEQLDLSNSLDGILGGNYDDGSATDVRNYGGIDGLPAAKRLFAAILDCQTDEVLVGGNASLSLMAQTLLFAHFFGVRGPESAWSKESPHIKILCPVPGYDRHFAICEQLGLDMLPVAMDEHGPDMDAVEAMVASDPAIKGIWCVPRFSNPSGIVYSQKVVERLAKLGRIAGANFRVMWDNAYAVHAFHEKAPPLPSIAAACRQYDTFDHVLMFSSTSKITFAGAGVAFMGTSTANLANIRKHLGVCTIGPDKVNQQRHVLFLRDLAGVHAHMQKHAAILAPRFTCVLDALDRHFAASDLGTWTAPQGGYFVAFETRNGCAKEVVKLAASVGVKLTPAGATHPYGHDPFDRTIRIAPSFASVPQVAQAMEVFCHCVKLAAVRQALHR